MVVLGVDTDQEQIRHLNIVNQPEEDMMRSLISILRQIVATIIIFQNCCLPCSAYDAWQQPPKITLDGYALADSYLTWNTNLTLIPLGEGGNDTTFVVPSSVRGLSLLCNASYPVEWTFHREKWNQRTNWQTILVNSRGSNSETLDPLWHSAELRFLGHNVEITGNYTCQKYGTDSVSRSVYVFWEGSSPPYLTLLASGSHRRIVLYNPSSSSNFVIPCTVSRPDIKVHLYKGNQTTELALNDQIKFDPEVGFTLTNTPNNNSLGIYTCTVGTLDDEDTLEFEVKIGNPTPEFQDQMWGRKAKYYYDPAKRQMVCCSSTSGKPPIMGHFYCNHPTTCQLQKHALHKIETAAHRSTSDNCAFLPLYWLRAGVFRCKGDSIDIVREYFFPMMDSRQRFSKSNSTIQPYYSWAAADPESMIFLTNVTGPLYVGESRRFLCRASRFYYSQGIHWTLHYDNETMIHVKGNHTQRGKNHTYGIFQQGNYAIIQITVDVSLRKLTCNAPIWNTTGWGTKSRSFKIEFPTPPKLLESNQEEQTWPTASKRRLLYCKFNGTPNPKVTWLKNGKIITTGGRKTNASSSYLNITKFDFDEATFTCNISNVGGFVFKSFKIYISDGLPFWKTALYTSGVIGLLLAAVGGTFAVWKMRQQKDAIQRLANMAFKDVHGNAGGGGGMVETSNIQNLHHHHQQQSTPPPILTIGEAVHFPSGNGSNSGPFLGGSSAPEFGKYQKM